MKKNIHPIDQFVRIMLAGIIIIYFFNSNLDQILKMTLLGLSIYFLFTSILGFCVIYYFLEINSNIKKKDRFY